MQTPNTEQLLAALERRVQLDGPPDEHADVLVAEALGVPLDAYVAYLLVWGAIQAYGLTHPGLADSVDDTPRSEDGAADGDLVEIARTLSDTWEHAGTIHEAAINGSPMPVVREQARRLVGALLVLTEQLLGEEHPARVLREGRHDG